MHSGLNMDMNMSPEQRVEMLSLRVDELATDLQEVQHFIKGNGDPTKGLLWLVADLSRLLATNTQLIGSLREQVEKSTREAEQRFARHMDEAHRTRRSEFWQKVQDQAVKQLVTGVIITFLSLLGLGIITFVRNGGHF